jgi:formamidopyrimidine-DNA glycosylase
VIKARRFGKVIAVDLNNGYSFLVHVKLTGQFIYRGPNLKSPPIISKKVAGGVPGAHTHVIFYLDKGAKLYYNDIRRFGWIRVMKTSEVEDDVFVKKLGPEPFGKENGKPSLLTLDLFKQILSSSKRAVKVVIMDQAKMGGVGNIYANDALWDSKIAPNRPTSSLTDKEVEELFSSIEKVLKEGIKYGGASELAFVTPDGGEGGYQKHFLAYGQEGKLCPRCKKEKFTKTMLGGRGTYFCSECQK